LCVLTGHMKGSLCANNSAARPRYLPAAVGGGERRALVEYGRCILSPWTRNSNRGRGAATPAALAAAAVLLNGGVVSDRRVCVMMCALIRRRRETRKGSIYLYSFIYFHLSLNPLLLVLTDGAPRAAGGGGVAAATGCIATHTRPAMELVRGKWVEMVGVVRARGSHERLLVCE
jgi:hypothetical protein